MLHWGAAPPVERKGRARRPTRPEAVLLDARGRGRLSKMVERELLARGQAYNEIRYRRARPHFYTCAASREINGAHRRVSGQRRLASRLERRAHPDV